MQKLLRGLPSLYLSAAGESKKMNIRERQYFMFRKAIPVWIEEHSCELNSICLFSAEFDAAEGAELVITANSFYKAYLNGEFVAFGPARAAHGYCRVDGIALGKRLRQGKNLLVVEAAGYNCRSFYSLDTPAFLQAEVRTESAVLACTGRDFTGRVFAERVRKVCRFSYQRAFSESYRFSRSPAEVYAAVAKGGKVVPAEGAEPLPRGVPYPQYESYVFRACGRGTFAVRNAPAPFRERYVTEKRLKIFPVSEFETFPAEYIGAFSYTPGRGRSARLLRAGEYALFSCGVLRTGFIRLSFCAAENSRVAVLFDEIAGKPPAVVDFTRNGCCAVIEYSVAKGGFSHTSFEPYTAKAIQVLVLSGKIADLRVSVVGFSNPDACRLRLSCSDVRLERIVEAARRTLADNAVDILTDCPSRERAGWLCDSFFSARSERLFTGENRTEQAFLENYALAPPLENLPEGMVPMCYPADFEDGTYIPNWAMWYLIELYDHTIRTGSRAAADAAVRKAEGLLRYFARFENEFGLLEDLDGWVFLEWSGANSAEFTKGVNFPSNMLYAKMLECTGRLFGKQELLEKAASLKVTVARLSFNGSFFEDNAVREGGRLVRKGHISETCQYYAFFSGVASPETHGKLFALLSEKFTPARDASRVGQGICKPNAFIGEYLRLIVLMRFGRRERAAKEFIQFFYRMARRTGTLWENSGTEGSLNHGFAAYAADLIVEYLCGFRGFRGNAVRIARIAPPCDCRIEIPTPCGPVRFVCEGTESFFDFPEGFYPEYEDAVAHEAN